MNQPELLHESSPRYDKPVIAAVIGSLMALDIAFILFFPEVLWFMLVTTFLELALFYFIVPRRYQIFSDRLRVVLGGPVKFDVPFSTVKIVRPAQGLDTFIYWGLRMATSFEGVVEIVRRGGGLDMVISPYDRDTFMEQFEQALAASDRNATPPKWRIV